LSNRTLVKLNAGQTQRWSNPPLVKPNAGQTQRWSNPTLVKPNAGQTERPTESGAESRSSVFDQFDHCQISADKAAAQGAAGGGQDRARLGLTSGHDLTSGQDLTSDHVCTAVTILPVGRI
jgi:hypothetical protein